MRPMLENALCRAKPIQPQAAMLTRAGGCLVLGGVRSGGFWTRAAQTGHSGYGKVWAKADMGHLVRMGASDLVADMLNPMSAVAPEKVSALRDRVTSEAPKPDG